MKKLVTLFICLSIVSGMLFAQTRPAGGNANNTAARNKAALDTVQYSLGVYLMQQVLASGYKIDNPTLFKKAIDDVLQRRPLMVNADKAQQWLLTYQQVYARDKGKQLEAMIFAQAKGQPGMMVLPNGINYKILAAGQGLKPRLQDSVILNVIGTLPDGTVFQDSYRDKSSLIAITRDLIPGLREVLQQMNEGSVWRVILPAALGYGETGNGTNIPANSALIFDVAIVAVRPAR